MKRIVVLLLALCMLFGMTACGKDPETPTSSVGGENSNALGERPAVSWDVTKLVDENFPFEQYVADEKAYWHLGRDAELTWYFNFTHHYTDKPWTEYSALSTVVDITGINVRSEIPTGDPSEYVRLAMATDTLPDLITLGYGDPLANELIEGGYVWDLNELMDLYAPYFQETLPEDLRVLGSYENFDGKFYSFVGVAVPDSSYQKFAEDKTLQSQLNVLPMVTPANCSYNVRKDIWQAMGEPSIATPDDLYNVLKQFKKLYPELGGKTSIALSAYDANSLITTMGYSFGIGNMYVDETGKCTLHYMDPKYPELIAYLNKLYREGLLDPEFAIKDVQHVTEDLSSCSFMMPYVWHAIDPANNILDATDPNSHFIGIAPMSAEGEQYAIPTTTKGGTTITLISKNTEDPEACIRLMQYGFSPAGTLQMCKGNPGQHYRVADGIISQSPEVVAAYAVDATAYNDTAGLWDYYAVWYPQGVYEHRTSDSADRVKYDYTASLPYIYDSTVTYYLMTVDPASDEGIALTTAGNIWSRSVIAAITAPTAAESASILQNMLTEIRGVRDLDKLEAFYTDRYQKNLELFPEPLF